MGDTFAVVVRMMWIDSTINDKGQINRADIMRAFAVSAPQANLDLKRYMAANAGRIAYDVRAKTYVQIEGSKPLFWGGARAAADKMVRQVAEVLNPPTEADGKVEG
jgi:hypothetical protein